MFQRKGWLWAKMRIFVTRHGQVATNAEYINGDVGLPKGEVPLSEMGRQQSTLLGKALVKEKFQGVILASPLLRTMETAELIAQETGSLIYPTPWMHEIFTDQESLEEFEGCDLEQLREYFPHIAPDATLVHPWWPKRAENHEDVRQRVLPEVDELLKRRDTDEEYLLVGHGASAGAVNYYLNLRRSGTLWNCCLGKYDTKHPERNMGKHINFLPGDMVSANKTMAMDMTFEEGFLRPYNVEIPEQLLQMKDRKECKVLHIGDTHSGTYPFYKHLIQMVKPDIIIHTGDTADEIKAGRIPEVRGKYLERVAELFEILKDSGSKVYWVPGNNDLPEEVAKMAPFLQILQPNTVLDIEGQRICVSHSREQIQVDADIYLYGHGKRASSFEEEFGGKEGEPWYFNNLWGVYLLLLPEKKFYCIEHPD